MTLVEFLLAQIEADEQVARAAVGPHRSESWHLGRHDENVMCFPPSSPEVIAWNLEHIGPERAAEHASWGGFTTDSDTAPHIARHDPARVLAECASKRAIVEWHKNWPVLVERQPSFSQVGSDLDSMTFRASRQIAWMTEQEYVARFGTEPPTAPILKMLAQPYADHPDFEEAWRP